MSYILLLLLLGLVTLSSSETSSTFDRIRERLESSGKRITVVGHAEAPEAASYLNHDLTQNVPHKVNVSNQITKSIREWTPRLLALDPTCPYYFSEKTNASKPEEDLNLLSYLLGIESNKTLEHLFISILPDSYRNAVPLLSILRCHHLVYPASTSDTFFHNVKLIVGPGNTELPFEQQSATHSQLFCSLSGWPQFVLVDSAKQSTPFNRETFLSQEKFDNVEFASTNLAPGTCLYIPPEWIVGGQLNNSISLSYILKKIEKPTSDDEPIACTTTGETTIDNVDFDIDDKFNVTEIGLVVYFYQYLNPPMFDKQFDSKAFFQQLQSDRNISQLVMKWTPELTDLIEKTLFNRLDINQDGEFSIDDYFEVKRSNLLEIQNGVFEILEKLRMIIVGQYQELNATITKFTEQVRAAGVEGTTGETLDALIDELPDAIKAKLAEKNANVKEAIDKVKQKKPKPSTTKQRVREDDPSVFFDEKQGDEASSIVNQEDEEEEITAEPVANITEPHRTDL
ncbi:unnamed protein product [Adineta ricciae]|uniref:EF-hand domain-containing protein n=1 Tax=Adineta ricciae TaxID=249248 RepID=A0A815P409_ADIRI|nr:unnamed protein product [Adineta ricciae]CAF1443846.1 unnamed protein product [Adineta ricciae]